MNCQYLDSGGSPRFDFIINPHKDKHYIIEYDGEKHFHPIPIY